MKRVFIFLLSSLGTLLSLELVLRLFWSPPEMNLNFRRHDIQWMAEHVIYNSYGYRDRQFQQEKPPGIFRIYGLGDSYTFGWYLNDPQQTYPKLLEKTFNDQQIPTEFINAASPGFSVPEEVDRFRMEGKFFHPDLVTIGVNYGDFMTVGSYPSIILPYSELLNKSYLYRLTLGAFIKHLESVKRYQFFMDIFQNPRSPDWQQFERLIRELKAETAKLNAALVIILFPNLDAQNPNGLYAFYPMHTRLEAFAKQQGITVIDPLPLYLAYPNKRDLVLNPIDAHPTQIAHRLTAQSFRESFDAAAYLKTHSPYIPTVRQISIHSASVQLPPYQDILSVGSTIGDIPWVYMEYSDTENIRTVPLGDLSFRQSPIYIDTLEMYNPAEVDQPGNVIGASLKYHVLAKNQKPGEIRIPSSLYGYPIAGIENIQALYMEKEGGTVKDFIKPKNITLGDGQMTIHFDKQQDYYVYQLELAVAVKQLTIAKGAVHRMTKTIPLTANVDHDTASVFIPVPRGVVGLPQFTESPTRNYPYAFVNGNFLPLKDLQASPQGVQLTFDHPVPAGSVLTIPVAVEYNMEGNETVTVQVEL